ncbi:MAG TPA: thiamine pyrophosphate-requiring protein [Candidatus Binatia bacterium]|nr:thiamine pyrophosphate-requiring protein [Candidatus Binatia bacterium]
MSITERAEATHAWTQIPADEVSDAIVASMALGGIDHLFFMSGSEIAFYQEAIAKAHAHGRPAPRLITMTHEHAGLNAALGYAAVSGKPAATACHVDAGTINYGGAIHTAWRSGLPVLMTAGGPPVAYPGSMRGARDRGGHIWMQQVYDQNGIVRQYTKWDHRLDYQDNPGLIVSRALQVAMSEPAGPVYLSLPREIASMHIDGARFPTVAQLGVTRPVAPDEDTIREIAERLVNARNPYVIVSGSGRNPKTFPLLVELCELLGISVLNSIIRAYQCFPKNHPLYVGNGSLKDADAVLVLEANVPWMPAENDPPSDAYIAVVDVDPIRNRIPTFEFPANVRMNADAQRTIEALIAAAQGMLSNTDRSRIAERTARVGEATRTKREGLVQRALSKAKQTPIDPLFLTYQIAEVLGDDCLIMEEVVGDAAPIDALLRSSKPQSYFKNPGSSGGWSTGAALGAKLAAPDRDVVALCGDGFYQYSVPNAAIWSAAHYKAPFMTVVYTNRSYSTGTNGVASMYPESYAAKAGFEGGYFDPPVDFAMEARAAGAFGETVRDPAELAPALRRGLEQIRKGTPAVISVWLPKVLQAD